MILSLSASSRPTIIPTTIPSPRVLDREGLFVEVLLLAREAGVLKLGTVALDGTKVHANASRHSALSWKHACELEARLKAEVAELMALAEAADGADVPDGMSVPEELARREDRSRIAEAKAVIEARARERLERERAEYEAKLEARAEKAEYEAKLEARAEKAEKTGRKPGGRPPEPPVAGPGPKDQVNLTDADSRIMPVAGGGFEQAYNAQALVAADSLLVVTNDVVARLVPEVIVELHPGQIVLPAPHDVEILIEMQEAAGGLALRVAEHRDDNVGT